MPSALYRTGNYLDYLPSMTDDQLNRLFSIPAKELYFHFAAERYRPNTTGELVRCPNSLFVELTDKVAKLQPGEIRRAVVDYSSNLHSSSFCAGYAATSCSIAHAEKALLSRIDAEKAIKGN